ncbi:MAG: polysaccharide biosynthesis/export family protein, partial [Deltaproteobacteria bacterium]
MKTVLSNIIRCLILSLIVSGLAFCNHFKAAERTVAKTVTVIDSPYIIGPMDILEIKVWKEPDFSRQAMVRPDGK